MHPPALERSVTWWGHATALLQVGATRLLTDPLLRGRLGHVTRRVPAVEPAAVGRVDAVLISHVHRDHLDMPTLRGIGPDVPVVAPRAAARFLPGSREVHELAEGETVELGGVRITATHATHRAWRGGRRVPALGYLVGSDVYFAGDTDLFAGMAGFVPLTLALLPVWGWGPTLGPGHLDPQRAAQALTLLRPAVAVPIHWGTYFPAHRSREHQRFRRPGPDFARHATQLAPATRVTLLAPGQSLSLPEPGPGAAQPGWS